MPVSGPKTWQFDVAWDRLAESGSVDSRGGAEYRRVVCEWHAAGCPMDGLLGWIFAAANVGPDGGERRGEGGEA